MADAPTLVFDLDGTLVDTAPDLIAALNFVLDREGLPPIPLHSARSMIGAGARKLIERGLEREGRAAGVKDINRMTVDFVEYYAAHIADASRPFEGLEGALDELSSHGFRFAVCSNKLEWLSKRLLDQLGLSPRFAAICGGDTFGVSKPDPDILRQTVARRRTIGHDRHGGRRRHRYRGCPARRRPGDCGELRLHRCADRRTQT